jgi:hypothetical protein
VNHDNANSKGKYNLNTFYILILNWNLLT